jgi:cation/acetate symporter
MLKGNLKHIEATVGLWQTTPIFDRVTKTALTDDFIALQKKSRQAKLTAVKESGQDVHRLLKDTHKKLKVSHGSPDWKAYVDFINDVVVFGLVALLLDIHGRAAQSLVIAIVGALMIVYVLIGGMKGTTWVQIIKAVLLITGAALMTVMVLAKFGLNFSDLLGSAQEMVSKATTKGVASRDVLAPGAQYGASTASKINLLSLGLALVLGTAGLPHVLMRFYTVPTAREARRSVVWAIALIGAFYLFTLVLGYGASAIVGPDRILKAAGGQNSAAPLLAFELGGVVLLGVISAVAARATARVASEQATADTPA